MIKCPNCPYETNRMDNLKRHLVKQKSCVPVTNGGVGTQSNIMGTHENTVGTQSNIMGTHENTVGTQPNIMGTQSTANATHPKGNACSKCAKVLSSKQALQKHESKCNGLSKKQCPTCHKFFATPQSRNVARHG